MKTLKKDRNFHIATLALLTTAAALAGCSPSVRTLHPDAAARPYPQKASAIPAATAAPSVSGAPTVSAALTASAAATLTDRVNAAGIKFYADSLEPGAPLFSPYGLHSAASIIYDGAREDTAAEMRAYFDFPEDREALRTEARQLRGGLIKAVKGSEFRRVSALWLQKGYELAPDFETILKSSYSAAGETADFRFSPEKAARTINAWGRTQTGGRADDFFAPNSLNNLTRLVMVNAVCFKGRWRTAFSTETTTAQEFTLEGGTKVTVQMMSSAGPVSSSQYEDEKFQAAALDYAGGRLRMVILLPAPGNTLNDIAQTLSAETLAGIRAGLAANKTETLFSLPRFKLSSSWDLAARLSALGMPQVFTEAADLSGMMGRKGLYLQKAVQKFYLEVDEAGGAPSASRKKRPIKKPASFTADRPFFFLIEDKLTGLILLLGRVDDPSLPAAQQ